MMYCTYFDKNYLPRGLAMLDSLYAQEPNAHCVVLCLDKLTQILLKQLCPSSVTLLTLTEFEQEYPEILDVKPQRSTAEYYWTLTPVLLLHLLRQQEEGDGVIYLDADQLFFSSPRPLLTAMRHNSVCLQPHRFPDRLRHLVRYGRYNVGALGARKDASGLGVVSWWRERCLEWCSAVPEGQTRYGDQKYLDFFVEQSPGVGEFQHPGIGVAPWNHENDSFSYDAKGNILFGKVPLVLFHFHSLVFADEDIVIPTRHQKDYRLSSEVIRYCYAPYVNAVDRAYARLREVDPRFSFGLSNVEVNERTPLLVRTSQVEHLCRGLPHERHALEGGFTYCEPPEVPLRQEAKGGNQWVGDFATWEEAARQTTGYDTEEIVLKGVVAARQVRDGKAVCERDTVLFQNRQYLWPTVSGVLLGAARNGGEVHLVDFGGGFGSMYYTLSPFLRRMKKVRWHVMELPRTAGIGKQEFQTTELLFHENLEDCLLRHRVDGVLMGAVLQYLPEPYAFLSALVEKGFDYIVLDRTSFHDGDGDRIHVQRVPEWIYAASYPCWALDYQKCLALLARRYDLVDVIPCQEGLVANMAFRGLVFTAKMEKAGERVRRNPEPAALFQQKLVTWEENSELQRCVNLGCGSRFLADWLNLDFAPRPPHVLGWNLRNGIPLPDSFVDAVYHSNLIEHFTPADARAFVGECLRVLRPGGILRIAAPDLEYITRCYLENLDKARQGDAVGAERYEWSVIELLDQLVRHTSGGEMLRYWAQKDVPAEDYVLRRVGTEYLNARKHILLHPPRFPQKEADALAVGNFRLGGEVHQWMYDVYSLGKLMRECGVRDIRVCRFAESRISGFSESTLEKNPDGSVYKPDSFYLEGVKP
jgi:putative methyltransferase (TIGR04325 family)